MKTTRSIAFILAILASFVHSSSWSTTKKGWGRPRPRRLQKAYHTNPYYNPRKYQPESEEEQAKKASRKRVSSLSYKCYQLCSPCSKFKQSRCKFLCKRTKKMKYFRRAKVIGMLVY
jgi:hypothetical protein